MAQSYPLRCPVCGNLSVNPELLDYRMVHNYGGTPYEFFVPELLVNKCAVCLSTSYPAATLELLTEKCREHMNLLTVGYIKNRKDALGLTVIDLCEATCRSVDVVQSWLDNVSLQDSASDILLREMLA